MEKQLQKYPKKCKLVLVQPFIKCGGRDDVSCYYRGTILEENGDILKIQFKYKGRLITEEYHKETGFDNHFIEDIKLKE